VLRFLLIAWCIQLPELIILAQTLHAATFGAYHASAVALINAFSRGGTRPRGQGIYNSITLAPAVPGQPVCRLCLGRHRRQRHLSIAAGCSLLGLVLLLWKFRRHNPA